MVWVRRIREPRDGEVTPYETWLNRRHFIGRTAKAAVASALVPGLLAGCDVAPGGAAARERGADPGAGEPAGRPGGAGPQESPTGPAPGRDWAGVRSELDEPLNSWQDITTYNNFYEFGTGKEDPARNAHTLRPRPWSVAVEGHVAKPGVYDLEDFLAPDAVEGVGQLVVGGDGPGPAGKSPDFPQAARRQVEGPVRFRVQSHAEL